MWYPYIQEESNPAILKDEEYKSQTRITIYYPGDFAPYEIICGVYGIMFHTVFAETLEEATKKYEAMKNDLKKYVDCDMEDDDFCGDFVDKWECVKKSL